jgi:hypothetical protein
MNEYTETASRMLEAHGYPGARIKNAQSRDENSWGTFSHSWHVQVGKEIERLVRENPGDYNAA